MAILRNISIRWKLQFLLFASVTISALSIFIYGLQVNTHALTAGAVRLQSLEVQAEAAFQSRILADTVNDLRMLRQIPSAIGVLCAVDNEGMDPTDGSTTDVWQMRLGAIVQSIMRTKKDYHSIRFVMDDGSERLRVEYAEIIDENDVATGKIELQSFFTEEPEPHLDIIEPFLSLQAHDYRALPIHMSASGIPILTYVVPFFPIDVKKTDADGTVELYKDGTPVLAVDHNQNETYDDVIRGAFFIDIDATHFLKTLSTVSEEGLTIHLINQEGVFLSTSSTDDVHTTWNKDRLFSSIYPDIDARVRSGETGDCMIPGSVISYAPLFPKPEDTSDFWVLIRMMDEQVVLAEAQTFKEIATIILVSCIIIVLLMSGFLTKRIIITPLSTMLKGVDDIAQGDLTHTIVVTSSDEIGTLGGSIIQMQGNLRSILHDIKNTSTTLDTSSHAMSEVSNDLRNSTEDTQMQSQSVAGAMEEMSANIYAMASAAEEMNVNVDSVSQSAEEVSSNMHTVSQTIEEIMGATKDVAQSSRSASAIADEASSMSETATRKINSLEVASIDIGKVTSVIQRIAAKTKLLALNATIEAASAGEAGKGFAVVASEIKILAQQSEAAATDIADQITGVQENTQEAVQAISAVSKTITHINASVDSINSAIDLQERATEKIVRTIQESTTGTKTIALSISEIGKGTADLAQNVSEIAQGASSVSESIQAVNAAAKQGEAGAHKVTHVIGDLTDISDTLKVMMIQFQIEEAASGDTVVATTDTESTTGNPS